MITVSILGCCVLRDTIEFKDKLEEITVERFIQFVTPMSMFGGKPVLIEDIFSADLLSEGSNFIKKCLKLDFKKQIFDYLNEVSSEYLLVDISDLVMYYYMFENGVVFTESRGFLENKACILKALRLQEEDIKKYRKGIFDISVNDIKSIMTLYAREILSFYKPSQIILVELYMAEKYVNEEGMPVCWWNSMLPTRSQNCILQIAYETLKQELAGCYTISFPKETYGDVNHKRGKYQRHYHDAYYEYLWNEMMKIMKKEE